MGRLSLVGIGASLALALLACMTGRLATPAGETKLGTDAAAQVEREIGLVHAPVEEYLAQIGKRLVERSSGLRTGISYRFAIVDMVEPNAFALPGGFVYVSRGMLALLNSEDELASVVAHEIGHVSARHHLRHALLETPLIPVRLATGIGSLATGIVSPTLGRVVGALGSAPGSLFLASYSRGQEEEADAIGQQLVASAGWDPRAIGAVMDALSREERLAGGDPDRISFFDTHPTTPSRSRRALERAAALPVAQLAPIAPDLRHFYEKLDGLLYGDSAAEGVIVDNEFLHPDLDVHIAFPDGWKIGNGSDGVVSVPEAGDALAIFMIAAKGDDPVAVANEVVDKSSLRVDGSVEATRIGGRPAARAFARSRAGWFTRYRHHIVWVNQGGLVYQLSGTALERDWPRYAGAIKNLVGSFRPLEADDRKRVREAHLRVVDARAGEHLADLLKRTDSAWSPERAAAANGFTSEEVELSNGRPLKIAHWERYAGKPEPSAQ
jgi:predicted Zn-dependent protease